MGVVRCCGALDRLVRCLVRTSNKRAAALTHRYRIYRAKVVLTKGEGVAPRRMQEGTDNVMLWACDNTLYRSKEAAENAAENAQQSVVLFREEYPGDRLAQTAPSPPPSTPLYRRGGG